MEHIRRVLGIAAMAAGLSVAPMRAQTGFESAKPESKLDKWDQKADKAELKQPKWDQKADKGQEKIDSKQSKWDLKPDKAEEKIESKQPKWEVKPDKAEEKRVWKDQAAIGAPLLIAQNVDMDQVRAQIKAAEKAMAKVNTEQVQDQIRAAEKAMQSVDMEQVQEQIRQAMKATENLDWGAFQAQTEAAMKASQSLDWGRLSQTLKDSQLQFDTLRAGGFGRLTDGSFGGTLGGLAFAPFQQGVGVGRGISGDKERAREAEERAREVRERQRDAAERLADNEQRKIDLYREGTGSVDEGRYEQAVSRFNRLLEADAKWSRADGALYWKAYALNKLGKRDEAGAAIGEISKQFPQSKWINDAKALQVEIQQSAGRPVSPDSIDDQDLKLLALQSLINSDAEKAVPLVDGVLKNPKNNLSLKAKALYVLAQRPNNERARAIVTEYAKSGANPDLQIRAVGYVGAWRSKESQQILFDIYSSNSDVAVKRAALRGMSSSRDSAHLLTAAKGEQNADLRREAIRGLGNMQAAAELGQLYSSETSNELKDQILSSLMNARSTDKLIEIAKTEKNAELRGDAIRYLGNMRSEKTADALAAVYGSESDKNVKSQIMRSLANQGAGKQLVEVVRNEKDGELKTSGVRMLGQVRGSKEASDYLMELISK
jgi:TolA-binding protein